MSITLDGISHSAGSRLLFEDVSITFNPPHRYGLTGPNGCGKSTLLKIIMDQMQPLRGQVRLPSKIGFLRQNIEDFQDFGVRDVVIMGNARLWEAMAEKERLYDVEFTDEVGIRFGELEEIIGDEDGYVAEGNAEELLLGAGIEPELHDLKMSQIPVDLQFRALLCQALFGNPQALLLDEPTNHLDMDSISWLEEFLHSYNGTLIVVSHDRHFLNAVTTHIADIDYETIIIYPGNYDQMVVTKTSIKERGEAEIRSKEKKISQLKEFVARFAAGTRASQVQSRLKEIERHKGEELKKSNIQRPYVRFPLSEKQSGKSVCILKDVCKGFDDKRVIEKFSLEIHRGDKIGIIGGNGRGKTTLLKMIAGILQPDSGKLEIGHQVLFSYFPQMHKELVAAKEGETVYDWLRSRKQGLYDQEIRGVLGKMLFGGDDAFKQVSTLSGGETARLILGGMMLEDHNCILLDEPNNHLDLEAVSALGWALEDYKSTAIVVGHDRELIGNFATKIIAFEEDGIHAFDGPLEEYLKSRKSP